MNLTKIGNMKKVILAFVVNDDDVNNVMNELAWGDMGSVAEYLNGHCHESDYNIEEYDDLLNENVVLGDNNKDELSLKSKRFSFNKIFRTSYKLEFKLLPASKLKMFEDYDNVVAQCHIKNVGCIIIDADYGDVIDNEYDLDEIYSMIETGKCL